MVVDLTNHFFSCCKVHCKGCSFLVQAQVDKIKIRQVGNWDELFMLLLRWYVMGRHGDRKTHVYKQGVTTGVYWRCLSM